MTPTRRTALGLILAGTALPAAAAPRARLIGERWTRFGTGGDPEHDGWTAFLRRHLIPGDGESVGLVDYAAGQADRAMLRDWIAAMETVDPATLTRPAAMAWWINLYNAVTVDLVLGAWPVGSIREVKGGLFDLGPWDEKVVRVAGEALSLDDIEHGILRPVWSDPRIHYGVNCASIGCPNLAAEPYRSDRLDAMLDRGARDYAAHPRGAEVTADGLVVSSIYAWFREDFGGTEGGVIGHLASHAPAAKAGAIRTAGRIVDDRYDWSINAA